MEFQTDKESGAWVSIVTATEAQPPTPLRAETPVLCSQPGCGELALPPFAHCSGHCCAGLLGAIL